MWRKGLSADEVVVLREREVRSRAGQVLTLSQEMSWER